MKAQIFSGASVGALLGILLGLSTSPVVALVVGAIAALLPQLTSLLKSTTPCHEDINNSEQNIAEFRLGAFALACAFGIIFGIFLRTHDALSPTKTPPIGSLLNEVNALVEIGVKKEEAQKIILTRYLETKPNVLGNQMVDGKAADVGTHTILFGLNTERCELFDIDNMHDINVLIEYFEAKNESKLASIAKQINSQQIDESNKLSIFKLVLEELCKK
ncbi:MAG: hypothetical protein PHI11_12005 [Gallionella sp.]|nr:hypothetical protein [Gallionella sp.]